MKIVVLLAAMTRGGIDLLQSLLDKHPEISQLPGKFYIDEFLEKINNKNNYEIAQQFIDCYPEYFDSRLNIVERHNFLGQNKNEFYLIDKNKFIKKFNELSKNKKLNKKEIIINLHLAYSSASGDSIDEKKLVILQIHHLFRIKSIEDLDFDIACTIRDPIASHSSYVKNLSTFNNKSINPWQYYYHMERNFSHLIKLSKLKRKINVIKLERLHRNNLDVMKNFCIQYQIDYKEILQKSTFHGKLWWGDQVSKKYLNGINIKFENNIDYNSFSKNDINIIEYYLENYIKTYKYTFKGNRETLNFKKYFPLKVDKVIFIQSIKKLNFKNLIFCFYYYLKRLKFMKKTKLDKFEYPAEL
jgi:hypothetical protein